MLMSQSGFGFLAGSLRYHHWFGLARCSLQWPCFADPSRTSHIAACFVDLPPAFHRRRGYRPRRPHPRTRRATCPSISLFPARQVCLQLTASFPNSFRAVDRWSSTAQTVLCFGFCSYSSDRVPCFAGSNAENRTVHSSCLVCRGSSDSKRRTCCRCWRCLLAEPIGATHLGVLGSQPAFLAWNLATFCDR